MREQLPKPFNAICFLPYWVYFLICITFFIVGASNSGVVTVLFYIFSLFAFVAGVFALVGKNMMRKMRIGTNPLYVIKKHPKDLSAQIDDLLKERFQVVSKTETTASLERKPLFDWLLLIVLALLGFFPAVLYVAWYVSQKPERVFLDLTTQT